MDFWGSSLTFFSKSSHERFDIIVFMSLSMLSALSLIDYLYAYTCFPCKDQASN